MLIITKKKIFSNSSRNHIRNKVRKFKNPFFDISFNLIYNINIKKKNIYIYIYIFLYTITFENLMNNATSHLSFLLCKSLVGK